MAMDHRSDCDSFAEAMQGEPSFLLDWKAYREKMRANVDAKKIAAIRDLQKQGLGVKAKYVKEAIGMGAWDSLMMDAQNKSLSDGWAKANEIFQWRKIVRTRNVRDFKTVYAIQTGSLPVLDFVPPGGAYHEVEFTDDRASYAVSKYGNSFNLLMEAVVNDDLGAFSAIPQRFGIAAGRTIEQKVFATLLDDDPTIYDAKALFHADHLNDLGATYTLNHDNLEAGKKLIRNQTDLDSNPKHIAPRFLIVHPDEEAQALRILRSPYRTNTANNDVNVHAGSLEIVVTPEITSGVWYLAADPAMYDTIELGFLGGMDGPIVFKEPAGTGASFDHDVERWRCMLIFGGAVLDYRGFVRGGA